MPISLRFCSGLARFGDQRFEARIPVQLLQAWILQERLRQFGIKKMDYLSIFGLSNDYLITER